MGGWNGVYGTRIMNPYLVVSNAVQLNLFVKYCNTGHHLLCYCVMLVSTYV